MFKEFDLDEVKPENLNFDDGTFMSKGRDLWRREIAGFLIWFDIYLGTRGFEDNTDHCGQRMFSTGPYSDVTHWGQSICFLENPIRVPRKDGEELMGTDRYGLDASWRDLNGLDLRGVVGYSKGKEPGSLEIDVTWDIQGAKGRQKRLLA